MPGGEGPRSSKALVTGLDALALRKRLIVLIRTHVVGLVREFALETGRGMRGGEGGGSVAGVGNLVQLMDPVKVGISGR